MAIKDIEKKTLLEEIPDILGDISKKSEAAQEKLIKKEEQRKERLVNEELKKQTQVAAEVRKAWEQSAKDLKKEQLKLYHDIVTKEKKEDQAALLELYGLSVDQMDKAIREAGKDKAKEEWENSKIKNLIKLNEDGTKDTAGLHTALKSLTDKFQTAINTYTQYQAKIDTRLLGTDKTFSAINKTLDKASVYYKNSDYITNLNTLVEQGIAENVEQRALLETVKDELVTTFSTTNSTLLRLVRIQEEDSTSIRMGMEAYLNIFLNTTYQNTEYLKDLYDTTSASLEEALSLLTAEQSISFEYQVQKWLGALYSKGMSNSGVSSLATAIGQLASGNINNLVGTPIGSLMAMASNGNFASYFKNGMTETEINTLMEDIVDFLTSLYQSSNNVVKSQLASTFGLSISDLKAASNVNTADLTGSTLSADESGSTIAALLATAGNRLSSASKFANVVDNLYYSLGSKVADNTILYGLYEASNMLDDIAAGIPLSIAGVNFKVSDIMRSGTLLTSLGSNIWDLMSGTSTIGANLLDQFNNFGGITVSGKGFEGSAGGQSKSGGGGSGDTLPDYFKKQKEQEEKSGKGEDDVDIVVPNIYKYMKNELSSKLDALIKLSAYSGGVSLMNTTGVAINPAITTTLGGTAVVISTPEVKDNSELTEKVNSAIININDILTKAASGELRIHTMPFISAGITIPTTSASGFGYGG